MIMFVNFQFYNGVTWVFTRSVPERDANQAEGHYRRYAEGLGLTMKRENPHDALQGIFGRREVS